MPTLGRTVEPELFLASLRAQVVQDFELIAVDQNPDERLSPLLAPPAERFPILHLRAPAGGVSQARNTGLQHAGGDVLAFPDDDCRYPPDLLGRVSEFFVQHPRTGGLAGRLVDEDGDSCILNFDRESGPIDKTNVWNRSIEATVFVRRESIRGQLFDEELGKGAGTPWGSGEGTDFVLWLLGRGVSLHYDPTMTVIHPRPKPLYDAAALSRAYEYGRGKGRVLRKHKYPLRSKIGHLLVPLGNLALAALRLNPLKARYHWKVFKGRLEGML